MNFIILSVASSLLVAEVINFTLRTISSKKLLWKNVVMDGGMPSRHAALVSSLTTALGLSQGFTSPFFLIALVFSLIVLRDAIGVRHNLDLAVQKLNKLLEKKDWMTVVSGHTPLQVLLGTLTGIGMTTLVWLLL